MKKDELIKLILKVIPVAMSVSVVVLNLLDNLSTKDSIIMLSFGLFSLSLYTLNKK